MVDFRKGITALALLVLFAGLAAAQVGGTGQVQLTCSTGVTVTPNLRNEGFTEQTGDITITCTGGSLGNLATAGTVIPQVNITIFYSTSVTSRLYGTSGTANPNEALLLIDEPGSGLPGPVGLGPNQPQTLCTTPFTGCQAVTGYTALGNIASYNPGTTTLSPNVYQGIASASIGNNAVTFFGVPVLPPTTTGSRVYRITNVRVNAVPLANQTQVYAQISASPASSLGIINSQLAVGYVSTSLSTSNGNVTLAQCASQTATKSYGGSLSFTEKFGTAFKTRIQAQATTAYAGQGVPGISSGLPNQNIPGFPYNSESNFVFPVTGGTAGLADFGTRLKATFTGVPSGVRIFVSTSNIINGAMAVAAPAYPGGMQYNGGAGAVSYAQLINGETTGDGSGGIGSAPPLLTNTDTSSPGGVPLVEVVLSGGAGTAVWEVMNTNPNSNETFTFGYYVGVASNTSTNTPLPGTFNVNLSYAPTTTSGAASNSLGIPRFSDTSAASKFLTINVCRTILLYPYLVNEIGLDTGIAIANTTQDPFGTLAQAGTCTLNFYPSDTTLAVPAPFTTATVKGGGTYTDTVSQRVPGFQGYMFAICNFQLAHGFAFISDLQVQHIAMGYLAVVLDDPANNSGVRWQHNTQFVENGAH
jgi:hypothetical protein